MCVFWWTQSISSLHVLPSKVHFLTVVKFSAFLHSYFQQIYIPFSLKHQNTWYQLWRESRTSHGYSMPSNEAPINFVPTHEALLRQNCQLEKLPTHKKKRVLTCVILIHKCIYRYTHKGTCHRISCIVLRLSLCGVWEVCVVYGRYVWYMAGMQNTY